MSGGVRGNQAMRTQQNPMAIRNLLNEMLPQQVAQNMVAPALRYRTGRKNHQRRKRHHHNNTNTLEKVANRPNSLPRVCTR